MLADDLYTPTTFKMHLLHEHSHFFAFKTFARPSLPRPVVDLNYLDFRETNLSAETFAELRTLAKNRPLSSPSHTLPYHYLEVKHVERNKLFYCCGYCEFYSDNLEELKIHTLVQHLSLRRKSAVKRDYYTCILADCQCEYVHLNKTPLLQ